MGNQLKSQYCGSTHGGISTGVSSLVRTAQKTDGFCADNAKCKMIKLEVPDVVTAIGLLETALKRELFLLDKSILDTKKKLQVFEES